MKRRTAGGTSRPPPTRERNVCGAPRAATRGVRRKLHFRIVSIEMVDGKPKVEWEPKTNHWTGTELDVKVKGAATLEGPWGEVPAGGEPTYRFFKVEVVLP